MQRSSRLQCMQRKHLHFSVILRPWVLVPPPPLPENWPGDLPLSSQALYRLSLSCRREREWVDTFPVFDRFLKLFQIMPSQSEICWILFLRWPVKVVIEKDDKSLFVSFNAKKHAEQLRKKKISFCWPRLWIQSVYSESCLFWISARGASLHCLGLPLDRWCGSGQRDVSSTHGSKRSGRSCDTHPNKE